MKSIKINFPNENGQMLAARLELPLDEKPYTYAIFAHCFTCTKNLNAVRNISRALSLKGIAVLSFDFTGLGESEGEFENTDFSSNVKDLVAAAKYLETNYQSPTLMIGHSLGGTATLISAKKISSVKAVVTIGSPFDPSDIKRHFLDSLDEINKKGEAAIEIGGRPFTIKKEFVEDLEQAKMEKNISELNKPLLVLHSPQDTIVGIDNAAYIFKAAKHPKSFISLDGADHLLSNENDSLYTGDIIACWMKKYIPVPAVESLVSDKKVVVRTSPSGFTTEIRAGNHLFLADEPESVGGKDLGPTPYDFLSAALGACTSMTLRMYADRKKWPLQDITVHLQHGKIHMEDSKDKDNPKSMIDRFEREIELEGDLTEEQKTRLLEIADKCPVHKTLHSENEIKTKLRD